jgi:hypothetical protein
MGLSRRRWVNWARYINCHHFTGWHWSFWIDTDDRVENSESDPLFQCILNLVFALGCQLSPDINPSEKESISDVFFQRSKKLFSLDILEVSSIKVVQALLLMGQYLQSTKSPGRCWIVVGLAIRIAQGLGLHMQYRDDRQKPGSSSRQLQIELRKRLWSGCIVLDRFDISFLLMK